MRKVVAAWLGVITVALCFGLKPAHAQEDSGRPEKSATSTPQEIRPKPESNPEQADKPVHAYRIDFSLNELEDGRKINTRHYSMNVNTGDRNQVKISSGAQTHRETSTANGVPTDAQSDFLSISIHIYCRVQERGDELLLSVDSVIDNMLTPAHTRPVNRNIEISGSTVATPGKPVMIGSVDDPTSRREFQLEVMATKVK